MQLPTLDQKWPAPTSFPPNCAFHRKIKWWQNSRSPHCWRDVWTRGVRTEMSKTVWSIRNSKWSPRFIDYVVSMPSGLWSLLFWTWAPPGVNLVIYYHWINLILEIAFSCPWIGFANILLRIFVDTMFIENLFIVYEQDLYSLDFFNLVLYLSCPCWASVWR